MMTVMGVSIGAPSACSPNVSRRIRQARQAHLVIRSQRRAAIAPSIVMGLFVYGVRGAGGFSAWAGSSPLPVVIPVVVRTTDDMLKLVPNTLREAAMALGCPVWKMVTMVTYRAARTGIVTGILLAIARISGETAPLLFTALNNQFWSTNLNAPMANLPVVIFQFAMSPYEDWHRLAWGGAALIALAVLVLNIIARALFKKSD
jgi:phosphate transport system permease protein